MAAAGGGVEAAAAGLLSLDDNTIVRVGGFLTARDLLSLALTNSRFSSSVVVTPWRGSSSAAPHTFRPRCRQPPVVGQALWATSTRWKTSRHRCVSPASAPASRSVTTTQSRSAAASPASECAFTSPTLYARNPGGPCWLIFSVRYSGGHRAALVGGHLMTCGRHYCEFTLDAGETALVGVCPASFDVSNGEGAHFANWMYHPLSGLWVQGRRSFPNITGEWKRPRGADCSIARSTFSCLL
jgi:hypothetical protein